MKKLIFPILFVILFIILLIFLLRPIPEKTPQESKSKKSQSASQPQVVVMSDTAYYQPIDEVPGVPSKTTYDNNYPGLSIFWVKASLTNGQDTCTLYDNDTKQIYASRYKGSNTLGEPDPGTTYYTNNKIKQDKAIGLLNQLCFKP